jgi:hypothetical protein
MMNKNGYEHSPRFSAVSVTTGSILALIVAMALSTSVHAEDRCSAPGSLTPWEQRACELARRDTPYALIHFFHRMNRINEGLNINDYVSKADAERWELARQKTRLQPLGSANANNSAKGAEKAN